MNILQTFFRHAGMVTDEQLDKLIPSADAEPRRLHEAIRWSVFGGGKRFRPALCLAAGRVFGVSEERLLRTAAAVEMIHTYSLIHDDLPSMDDDDLRRGRATCHKKFDEATAILAGDVLQTMAFQAIAGDSSLDESVRLRLVGELAQAAAQMVAGQQMDIGAEGRKVSLGELEDIHRKKTGAMIVVSARAAAIAAGAAVRELEAISVYARQLGLLFQITDDLLDLTQTTEVLGKTAGKDLAAHKATYPSFYGIEGTKKLAREVRDRAIDALSEIDGETRLLENLADYLLDRQS